MRKCRSYGSVRGAVSDGRPYRDPVLPNAKLEARMVSLFLSCRALSSPTLCRFIPAHCRALSYCWGFGMVVELSW